MHSNLSQHDQIKMCLYLKKTLHHIHKMLQYCWRKSFLNTQNPWASWTHWRPSSVSRPLADFRPPPTQNPGSATDYHPIFNFRFAYLFSIKLLFHLFFLYLICSCTIKSYSLKPLNQIKPNLAGMVSGWVPFKIESDSPALHSRWLMLLKIEISSFVHCCFCISQNELKF